MSFETDITAIKSGLSYRVNEDDEAHIDHPDPSGLLRAAHDPKNCLLVWWYNPETAEFIKNKDPKHLHALDVGKDNIIKDYKLWARGRVFDYHGIVYLIIYYPEERGLVRSQLGDIFDKAYNTLGSSKPITQVIDDNGTIINDLLEGVDSYLLKPPTPGLGCFRINEYGDVVEYRSV